MIIFAGTALDRLMHRLGLGGCSPRDITRRVLFWIGLLWLPPLLFSGLGSLFEHQDLRPSIFTDLVFHIRYLVAVPLLFALECRIQKEFTRVIPAVLSRAIVRNEELPILYRLVAQAGRLQLSIWSDFLLLALGFTLVLTRLYYDLPTETTSWKTADGWAHLFAQTWNYWISLPLFYFVMFRWLWRFFVWSYFLVRLVFLELNIKSLHPDRVGGLAFLLRFHKMFGLVALTVSLTVSANIATLVWFGNSRIDDFVNPLIMYVFIFDSIFALPLAPFTPLLVIKRNNALTRYSRVANSYAARFDRKWLTQDIEKAKALLGNPDFQSLNDLHGSYRSLVQMRINFMDSRTLIVITALITIPFSPLILFKIPTFELIKAVGKYLFNL